MVSGTENHARRKALGSVADELARQDAMWGNQEHPLPIWATIIGEEYGETCQAVNELGFHEDAAEREEVVAKIYAEAVQTAACCVALCESILRSGERDSR